MLDENFYQKRIAELEKENADLLDCLERTMEAAHEVFQKVSHWERQAQIIEKAPTDWMGSEC